MNRIRMALLSALLALPALAQREVIVPPRPPLQRPHPVRTEHSDVELRVEDGSAQLTIRQTLFNPSDRVQEAWLHLPLPKGARAHDASLRIGEDWVEAELLDAGEARRAYEEIVARCIDPALIEYIDDDLVRARVFPVPPRGRREVELTVQLLLPLEFDAYTLRLPLKALAKDGDLELSGDIVSRDEMLQPFSPTHELELSEMQANRARIRWHSRGTVREDMHLVFPLRPRRLGAYALSSRPAGDDGFALVRITPGDELGGRETLSRDLILTVDVSGSMRGEKLRQAQAALRAILDTLNPDDRFAILSYSADVWPLTEGLNTNTERNREAALRAIDELRADGGTNIEAALSQSLALCERGERVPYLLFVTDGLPSVGEQDVGRLLEMLKKRGDALPRIFAFGVGTDVNALLLDGIAERGRAVARYVLPGENLEIALSQLAAQIREPIWTDLELESNGVLREFLPSRLGDLFAGQSLTVLARYRRGGDCKLTLRGRAGGRRVEHRFDITLEEGYGSARYLPRLWATTRIAELERRLRDHPGDRAAENELLELATRYGVVTAQTSLLARENDEELARAMRRNDWDGARDRIQSLGSPAGELRYVADTPAAEVRQSSRRSKAMLSTNLQGREEALSEPMAPSPFGVEQQILGGRVFELQEDRWVDKLSAGAAPRLRIAPLSAAWWELARMRPDLREMLGSGHAINFALGSEVVSVEAGGIEELSAGDRAWLATARL